MNRPVELSPDQLRRRCDPSALAFASTADVAQTDAIIDQDRAAQAIEFGINISHPGYNIFATGTAGTGKSSIITRFLEAKAASRPVPPDWGYIEDLADDRRSHAVRLPPGGGNQVRDQVDALLDQVAAALAKAFAGEQYAESENALERRRDQLRAARLQQLETQMLAQGFALSQTPMGLAVAPAHKGRPITAEQFQALPQAKRERLTELSQALEEDLERALRQVREIEATAQEQLAHLDREVVAATIRPLFQQLTEAHAGSPDVVDYLSRVQAHIIEHAGVFKGVSPSDAAGDAASSPASPGMRGLAPEHLDRYRLNVLVDNSRLQGAPVVTESNPTYANLIGRVEMRAELGAWVTDYRQIKSGALHRANGGYLLLDADALLRQPLAWEGLKRALRDRSMRIEAIEEQTGVMWPATLIPDPIPLDVKVVLTGDPETYYLLHAEDSDFQELFKVQADFASEIDWTPENERKLIGFIRSQCEQLGLPHFDPGGAARVVETSARIVEDQRRLSARFALISDIVREAAFWAQRAGHALVAAGDVDRAIAERRHRSSRIEELDRQSILDGVIGVQTTGAVVGQVNGLAVLAIGDHAFGRPTRITATTYQGRAGVISIEREARLSGSLHDKGVLTLCSFLGGRFAQDKPLSLSANIAFEQAYDGVDGDSASSTELYALLSSLAGLPLSQGIAATGSVDQYGSIQAVGGATAKIEGFFDTCRAMPGGLTGDQGVIIPCANAPHLMLRDEVVAAVAAGRFHVWPVRTIDKGVEILTGVQAGERAADGAYAPDSVSGRVDRRLRELAESIRRLDREAGCPTSSTATT